MKHFEEHVEDVSLILDEEECSDTKQTDMILDVGDRPPLLQWLFLSFQHVFAMFGATILVPTLTGLPVSVALFASGVGTLIYTFVTKRKVPVYLGSSFAYISAVVIAIKAMGGSVDAAQTGLMLVGVTMLPAPPPAVPPFAEEPVHIGFDFVDGGQLIGGFLVRESVFQFFLC